MAGAVELDPYVVDVLLPDLVGHDRSPSAFLVFLYLWRQTGGGKQTTGELSLASIAEATGLSKRAVQMALARLVRRQLVTTERRTPGAGNCFGVRRPWLRTRR
jgi:DNA-binding transcriptional ArsR family regulator